jgi:RNA polymerase sigma-70 factor (ECF subfamily)
MDIDAEAFRNNIQWHGIIRAFPTTSSSESVGSAKLQAALHHVGEDALMNPPFLSSEDVLRYPSSNRTVLMRQFGSDQREEFERIALVHTDALLGVARRILRCDSLAEDAVQETLLSAWRAFHQFQRDTNSKAWLFRILLNGIRKNWRRAVPLVELPIGQSLDNIVTIRTSFKSLAHSDATAAIDALPEEQRTVFLLAAVEGFTCKEISSMQAIPIGTVMSRLSRSRAELRRVLSQRIRAGDRERKN